MVMGDMGRVADREVEDGGMMWWRCCNERDVALL
jgi:hypothetical protein